MASATEILSANGISNAAIIVQAAGIVGLDIASAAAMVEKETGGRMIWGHDPVDTGGTYTKGGPVTVANYWAYRKSPTAGWQGVGITQLTYKGYIYQAESLNAASGAADPLTNCRVGFAALQDNIRQYGLADGARRYNGSGSAANAYSADFMAKRSVWVTRFAGATAARPTLTLGDTQPADLIRSVQTFMNKTFPAYSKIDTGPGVFGPGTAAAVTEFQKRSGIPSGGTPAIGPNTWAALEQNGYR